MRDKNDDRLQHQPQILLFSLFILVISCAVYDRQMWKILYAASGVIAGVCLMASHIDPIVDGERILWSITTLRLLSRFWLPIAMLQLAFVDRFRPSVKDPFAVYPVFVSHLIFWGDFLFHILAIPLTLLRLGVVKIDSVSETHFLKVVFEVWFVKSLGYACRAYVQSSPILVTAALCEVVCSQGRFVSVCFPGKRIPRVLWGACFFLYSCVRLFYALPPPVATRL